MLPLLIVICGPTASGKSVLAMHLAEYFKTVIVSADSRQIYKEMSIGTAKPSQEDLRKIKHYFIGSHSIHQPISAGEFEKQAIPLLENLFKIYSPIIMVGGTGLYIDAVLNGLDEVPKNDAIKQKWIQYYQANGLERLKNEITKIDPNASNHMDINNPHRMIRALEVFEITGKLPYNIKTKAHINRIFKTILFGISTNRDTLYKNIEERVDKMIDSGLEKEARQLLPYKNLNALNTVGYKELFSYFNDEISKELAIEKIKQHTRNYAKRQITWFSKKDNINWINLSNQDQIIHKIESLLNDNMIKT